MSAHAHALAPTPTSAPAPAPIRTTGPEAGDLLRFERQLGLPGLGPEQQGRLQAATVLIAGIGGIGGAVATYLAAAGVGRLILVHPGQLEEPDLNRQTLMEPAGLGRPRVAGARRTLQRHYPGTAVEGLDCGVADPRVAALVAAADLVVDARHNFPERRLLSRICRQHGVTEVVAAMDGGQLQLAAFGPKGPCWECLLPTVDPHWDPLGFRVLGAVAGAAGCLAATEVVKLLTGAGSTLLGRLLYADLWEPDFRTFRVQPVPGCPGCGPTG